MFLKNFIRKPVLKFTHSEDTEAFIMHLLINTQLLINRKYQMLLISKLFFSFLGEIE